MRGPHTTCHADITGIHLQRVYTETPRHGGAAVAAAVQYHQHFHVQSRLLRLPGSHQHRPQASPKAAGFVMRRDDNGDHGQVSSRSTTLGWHDQYSSKKSASSWRNC
ncbi:hypothetical protein D3C72_1912280 [compost metagenome]